MLVSLERCISAIYQSLFKTSLEWWYCMISSSYVMYLSHNLLCLIRFDFLWSVSLIIPLSKCSIFLSIGVVTTRVIETILIQHLLSYISFHKCPTHSGPRTPIGGRKLIFLSLLKSYFLQLIKSHFPLPIGVRGPGCVGIPRVIETKLNQHLSRYFSDNLYISRASKSDNVGITREM